MLLRGLETFSSEYGEEKVCETDFFFVCFPQEKGVETKEKKWLERVESMTKHGIVQVTCRLNREM